jgi:RNA polymerase sigma factor FliA
VNECPKAYLNLVRKIAIEVGKTLPPWFEMDDLVGDGCLGLTKALQSYDPSRNIRFTTYAYPVIKFAILQGLRNRGDRRTAAGRLKSQSHISLNEPAVEGDPARIDLLPDRSQDAADVSLLRMEKCAQLRSAVNALPSKYRLLIEDHYFRQVPLFDIARRRGLSASRISQLRIEAILRLRSAMNGS